MDSETDTESDENIRNNLFNYSLLQLEPLGELNGISIEIRPSPIHGNGLFATRDISKNTLLTFYPAHAIHMRDMVYSLKQYDTNNFCDKIENESYNRTYGYEYDDHITLIGNPAIVNNKFLLGHMINDAGLNVFAGINHLEVEKNLKNIVVRYYLQGISKLNCEAKKDAHRIKIITTRDIVSDEELLMLYGLPYWYGVEYDTNSDEIVEMVERLVKSDDKFRKYWLTILEKMK